MTEPRRPRLDHVGVFVSDLGRARLFYERHLGMEFLEEGEDEGVAMVTMRSGEQEVHLFKSKRDAVPARFDHVSYRVDGRRFEELRSELAAAGVACSGPHRYQNTRFIKFSDPDGLVWEYVTVDA
jgi:catechol 2,3-dioxygenase-like lactoylglutathione lyase family enzyme